MGERLSTNTDFWRLISNFLSYFSTGRLTFDTSWLELSSSLASIRDHSFIPSQLFQQRSPRLNLLL